jgi:hypothetical protein
MVKVKSKLMFAVHQATRDGKSVGTLSLGVWPLAFSDVPIFDAVLSYANLDGFWALWDAVTSPEEFGMCSFGGMDLDGFISDETRWGGVWVYEVGWDVNDVHPECEDCSDPDMWKHLHGGFFRRPTPRELGAVVGGPNDDWKVIP